MIKKFIPMVTARSGVGSGGDGSVGGRGMCSKAVTMENINPNIVKLEYAVRGPLVIRAAEIERELKQGSKKPFSKVIRANIGDAHAMGQKPITFIRQVLASAVTPGLASKAGFPDDVRQRAEQLLAACGGGSVGAYTMSTGIELIRRHVAEYIERRDGHPANPDDIVLTAGASLGIRNVLQLLVNQVGGKPTGVLIPIPQYPLYSASLAEFGLEAVGYYLDEERGWALPAEELERALRNARCSAAVRALVVINPGNPTGQVLTRENIESVIKFARTNNLLVFADEVYQDNVYAAGSKFFAFKKVLREMGGEFSSQQELASFMSVSKGYAGECGLRGGWIELVNLQPQVQANMYKGAMYAFPRLELPPRAVEAARKARRPPDVFYAFQLLEETGICVVAGSGFGQRPGTYHFRTTILPQPALLNEMLNIFKSFHEKFTKQYS